MKVSKQRAAGYIYLSSPYSHPHSWVRHNRWVEVCRIAGKLLIEGYIVHCPIAESHAIVTCHSPAIDLTHDDWMAKDLVQLSRSDMLFVAMIDGWEESLGVQEEIRYAKDHNIPIKYVTNKGEIVNDSSQA